MLLAGHLTRSPVFAAGALRSGSASIHFFASRFFDRIGSFPNVRRAAVPIGRRRSRFAFAYVWLLRLRQRIFSRLTGRIWIAPLVIRMAFFRRS